MQHLAEEALAEAYRTSHTQLVQDAGREKNKAPTSGIGCCLNTAQRSGSQSRSWKGGAPGTGPRTTSLLTPAPTTVPSGHAE